MCCNEPRNNKRQAHAKWRQITAPLWCFGFGKNVGACYLCLRGTTTQDMRHKLNVGRHERASRVPDVHFKSYNLGQKNSLYLPKTAQEREMK